MELPCAERLSHLAGRDVLLWCVDLDRYATTVALEGFSSDEQAFAARKVFARDRSRYLACRHALRRLLGASVGLAPADVRIDIDEGGKPVLAGGSPVEFNVSHSDHVGLIGLSWAYPIGVDIETDRVIDDVESLVELHFTDGERAECAAAGSIDHRRFLTCWTRKEAGLKALGIGLVAEPATIHTGCAPCTLRTSLETASDRCEVTVYPVSAPSDTLAAVALAHPADVALARRSFVPR
ncbi:MAG: 4'-phosphopantetheinyl transferase superfamily protein [Burkholderiaceae bacterium]